jgi:tripartite-type tricarboxylate transporter receptor subunit TctC
MKRSTFLQVAAAAILAAAAPLTAAQDAWPSRPIRLVVPLPPGGGGDLAARLVATELSARLKQNVIVENRPGAGSVIGTQVVARAEPNGYTIGLITDFHSINAALSAEKLLEAPLPFDPLKDFAPVARLVNLQIMLMASPRLGARTLQDVIAKAKQGAEQVSAASPGSSSPHHLTFLMLQQQSDTKLLAVPFQGSGPATLALMAGQVDLAFATVSAGQQMARDGRAVPIAVSGSTRDPRAPDVPTISESGFPGVVMWSWMGIVAPAGTPAPIVARLNEEINQVLRDPQVAAKLGNAGGMTAAPGSQEEFTQVIARDTQKIQALLRTQPRK